MVVTCYLSLLCKYFERDDSDVTCKFQQCIVFEILLSGSGKTKAVMYSVKFFSCVSELLYFCQACISSRVAYWWSVTVVIRNFKVVCLYCKVVTKTCHFLKSNSNGLQAAPLSICDFHNTIQEWKPMYVYSTLLVLLIGTASCKALTFFQTSALYVWWWVYVTERAETKHNLDWPFRNDTIVMIMIGTEGKCNYMVWKSWRVVYTVHTQRNVEFLFTTFHNILTTSLELWFRMCDGVTCDIVRWNTAYKCTSVFIILQTKRIRGVESKLHDTDWTSKDSSVLTERRWSLLNMSGETGHNKKIGYPITSVARNKYDWIFMTFVNVFTAVGAVKCRCCRFLTICIRPFVPSIRLALWQTGLLYRF